MVYLMVGCPGSGKSTYLKNNVDEKQVVSRDKIRFELLKDGEAYFSKEKAVFKIFIEKIQELIDNGEDVFIDATHLNKASRFKTISNLDLKGAEVTAIVIKTPLDTCLARNAQRTGRALVPEESVRSMFRFTSQPNKEKEPYIDYIKEVPNG